MTQSFPDLVRRELFHHGYSVSSIFDSSSCKVTALETSYFAKILNKNLFILKEDDLQKVKQMSHPRIVHLKTFFHTQSFHVLISDFIECQSMDEFRFEDKIFIPFAKDLLSGFQYSHQSRVFHSNIKPSNILIDRDTHPMLCDFSVSKCLNNEKNLPYLAPEVLSGNENDPFKSDVWSLGIVLYEALYGKLPWRSKSLDLLEKEIIEGNIFYPDVYVVPQIKMLVMKMLKINPADRATADELFTVFERHTKIIQKRRS